MMNNEHTSKQFEAELEAVRARVLQMGGLVEEQIKLALDALISGDLELCTKVENNDHLVNAQEVGIDEDCSTIIARRHPVAGDLRMLMTVVKTITDLERIGDSSRAPWKYAACRASRWRCCANRSTPLHAWIWRHRRKSCDATSMSTMSSAVCCAS